MKVNSILINFILQPRSPKVNRKGPHSHQRQPTLATTPVLQEQEVPTPRSPTKANPRHSKTFEQAREREDFGEDEEAGYPLPCTEVCYQGTDFLAHIPSYMMREEREELWCVDGYKADYLQAEA
jgi:hypothetical protein